MNTLPRFSVRERLDSIAAERILILDGAMGTMVQAYRLPSGEPLSEADFRGDLLANHPVNLKSCSDVLCLTKPEVISSIHEAYLEAGADIIETCSLNSTSVSLADYGIADLAYEISVAAASIARKAADGFSTGEKPRFVAGSIGPTSKSGSMSPYIDDPGRRAIGWDELEAAFYDNVRGLLDGGADILLIETIFDTLNAKAAVAAIRRLESERRISVPLMISATVSNSAGRVLSGQTMEAFCASVSHAKPWSIGLNCSFGAEKLIVPIRRLSETAPCLVSAYPNAGLPNQLGGYDETPETMRRHLEEYMKEGLANILGGCCGSTPAHIAAIARTAKAYKPRRVPAARRETVLAGYEALRINSDTIAGGSFPFVRIGERANVSGCKKFLDLIRAEDYETALGILQEMVDQGAAIINVGVDDPLLDAGAVMPRFLNIALADPEIARFPFMIDSSRWEVIEAALKCVQGKALVNSISLKDGETEFLRRAFIARGYGAAIVVMLFDEQGQAVTFERKIEIAGRAYRLLTENGFPAEDIVFDPNVLTIVTGIPEHDSYALAFIRACSWIREHCPGVQITGGISNLSFSFRGNRQVREAMHAVFLYHAARAGLTMAIVNPGTLLPYDKVGRELRDAVEDVIFCAQGESAPPEAPGQNPQERLVSLAVRIKNKAENADPEGGKTEADWRALDAEERVFHAMICGIDDFIEADVLELKNRCEHCFQIVEGPLMRGMKEVGDRFGAGKMYLPQVIRSARVMKKAVAALEPFIRKEKAIAASANGNSTNVLSGGAKILLATVKGDVHDIGKNITGVVLDCNGYDIIDLGVMVPAEQIIERAVSENAAAVGLSGLITPSLDEMAAVARGMEKRGLKIPLLIGGAAASVVHTALRLAPEYSGPVVYIPDAGRSAGAAASLFSDAARPGFLAALETQYREALALHETITAKRELLSLKQARENRFVQTWAAPEPKEKTVQEFDNYPVERVIPFINWKAFLRSWEMGVSGTPGGAGQDSARACSAAEKLLADAKLMLGRIEAEGLLCLRGAVGFFPAASENEDIIVYESGTRRERARFSFLRYQEKKQPGLPSLCLADFVAPASRAGSVSGNANGDADSSADDSIAGEALGWIGLFALGAGFGLKENADSFRARHDDYGALLLASLANSLAEAFSEEMHLRVQREFWGYNPSAPGGKSGIRPAFGYPACPDHNDKRLAFALLDARARCGFELTDSSMIIPAASVCGMYIAHPGSRYFGAGF
ncbi:MAG: methionine synthase, partial [Spirochaetaceae bacterium]|nr:methionine synthase [Spirochaetaceae bacterium]